MCEVTIPDYNEDGDDMYLELSAEDLRERIEASGMLNQLHSVVQQCIADMKGIIPNQLEIMDNGILTVPFYECVNNVCKENGVEISSFTFMLEA
jgi:hypothetical protein